MNKTCAFYTLGCKVNQYETQAIREGFDRAGYRELGFDDACDVYVINTCTVTAKTDRESRRLVRGARRKNPNAKIVVTGCYAELDSDRIMGAGAGIAIVKNREKAGIADMLGSGSSGSGQAHLLRVSPTRAVSRRSRTRMQFGVGGQDIAAGISDFKNMSKAFLKIQDGCDNFCAYCKVPLVRGGSRSREIVPVMEELERLLSKGFKEVILTGICLGAWGCDISPERTIAKLLEDIAAVKAEFRIRLSSIEPKYVDSGLVMVLKHLPKMCRHLHMPFQSGDDKVLKSMNRPYTASDYMKTVEMARRHIPDISITTDIMVGFPGETEDEFRNTLDFLRRVMPSRVHVFTFSRRPGTAAYQMQNNVCRDEVKDRLKRVTDTASELSLQYRKKFLGKYTEVLVESEDADCGGFLIGYDDKYIKITIINGDAGFKNKLVSVKIEKVDFSGTYATIQAGDCRDRGLAARSKDEHGEVYRQARLTAKPWAGPACAE